MKRGRFIVIDGIDGSGKSTQMRLLKKRLGRKALFTFDPGGTKTGRTLRDLLLSRRRKVSPLAVLYLFLAARASLVQELIEPALKKGMHVLCDRFDASTHAYQIRAGKHPEYLSTVKAFAEAAGGVRPDVYIILDLNSAEARRRVVKGGNLDVYESKPLSFYKSVREGLMAFRPHDSTKFVVDASGSRREVHENVWAIVRQVLNHR